MRQTAGEFAPRCDAFRLNGPVALLDEMPGHLIERLRQLADLIVGEDFDARRPIAGGDRTRSRGEPFHGMSDALSGPPSQQNADSDAGPTHDNSDPQDGALESDLLFEGRA